MKDIRNIEIVFYLEELELFNNSIDLCKSLDCMYAYILHDKDLDDDNNLKKPHYHLRIFAKNQKTLEAWSKYFNISVNRIQIIKKDRKSIRYLIHADSKTKYHYSITSICSNFDLSPYFTDKTESLDIESYINYIDNIKGVVFMKDMLNYALSTNSWSTYRRNYSIIRDIIYEHNNKYIIK